MRTSHFEANLTRSAVR